MQTMIYESYHETVDDSPGESRSRERDAFSRSIEAMRDADANPGDEIRRMHAIAQVNRLWSTLLEDLASPDNALPVELRARIISIGIFVLRHCETMRNDNRADFSAVIDISSAIHEGLG